MLVSYTKILQGYHRNENLIVSVFTYKENLQEVPVCLYKATLNNLKLYTAKSASLVLLWMKQVAKSLLGGVSSFPGDS